MKLNKFNIYPAIHLRNGKVVRFTKGDINNPIVFHTDPLACAKHWIEQGAEWLQLVNLDAAFDEEASHNWALIEQICGLEVNIQFGGGIRKLEDVDWAIKSGIKRVVIGTAAVENPQLMAQAIARYGSDAIALAIDTTAAGEVKIHGWKSASIDLASISGLRIIVGGGIGSLQDVRESFNNKGIDGVIIGKALYTGNVDLKRALHIAVRKESFEAGVASWKTEQSMPWNRFGYELIEHNLKKHIPMDSPPLRILDAGGGNGLDALALARMNHHVDIVDISQQMLNDARANAALAGVTHRVDTHAIDIHALDRKFPAKLFDLVLCHNLIQFVDDLQAVLESIVKMIKPGGMLSLITTNQYSLPYQAAFLDGDLDQAYKMLDEDKHYNSVFDINVHEYRHDDIITLLEELGLKLEKHYGIRCLYNYWGTNELKQNTAIHDKLKKLEMELTERYPYKLGARQFQLIARKQ